ncbi:TPR-like protein [Suillus americanus]|nr:TPR-like protein [Suillus americanus]
MNIMDEEDDFYGGSLVESESDYADDSESDDEEKESEAEDIELPQGVQAEIDTDFNRLVSNIRMTDDVSNAAMLHREWDFNIAQQDAEFRDDLREASGIGKKKGRKRGRQHGPVLSHQVRALIGEGNQAYVDGNIPDAIRIMQEVIRIEPRASSAWSVIAQCYEDSNEPKKALQLRIMAAHLRHDADEWERLAAQSRDLGYNQQAIYCYSKVYSLDPTNVDALWDRASLAKEINDLRTARHSLLAILKRFPHDMTVLAELRPILIEVSDLPLCTSLYHAALEHYQTVQPLGPAQPIDPSLIDQPSPNQIFGFIDLLVLADLYNTMAEHDHAIQIIRKGCRWLQGRASQRFWDGCVDDREYDLPREDRGNVNMERSGDVQPGHYPLDVNARHRLAIARIKLGEVEEGKMHASIVLAQDVLDYAALFGEIADSYFEREMYADARPIYEILGADPATSSFYVLLQVAVCRRMLGDLQEAAEVYKQVIDADQTSNDAKMKLAELYEIMDEPRKALELVYQVIDSRKRRNHQREATPAPGTVPQPQGASLFEEKSRTKAKTPAPGKSRLTLAELKALEEQREREVILGYNRVEDLWPRMLHGDVEAEREWMIEAEKLVEMFRETRNLFLTTRDYDFKGMFPKRRIQRRDDTDEDRMLSRLELNERDKHTRRAKDDGQASEKVDSFRGVTFSSWLRIFMQYAFVLTKRGDYDQAEEVLRHVLLSNAYRDSNSQNTIRIAIITCAVHTGKFSIAVEQCRKIINTHQFNNEAFRLLLVSLASGHRPTDSFVSSTLQKHVLRELRLHDASVKTPELMKWNVVGRKYNLSSSGKEEPSKVEEEVDEEAEIPGPMESNATEKTAIQMPTKNNPIIVTLYGQMSLAAKSYQSAICKSVSLSRNPVVCLSLAIASLGRAMQRQSDNRHHMIAQGMAFLSQYRTLRKSSGDEMLAEVDYNFGRAFHQLGLHTHAVSHYERVLEIAEKQGSEQYASVAKEAAYNLSLIYVTTGAVPLADELYKRWLSI